MTLALGFDFRIMAVEILALKTVTFALENYKSLIGIKNFRSCEWYKCIL